MALDLKERKNELLFLPLGGAKEIGMNLNLYHYQGKWLMVDLGAGFADDYFPGVDLIVPDISFLDDKKKDLLGLVLTHAHEDHLGAVQYLWHYLRCPIYTTPFTHSFLKAKLTESDFKNEVKIHEIKEGSKFELAPFSIELVPITHSTPEMQGLMIRTNVGNIFHTGDWKFDPQPLVGNPTDLKKLKQLGNEGVLALVGDSTNVFNKEPSGSEGDLRESLTQLISSCKKAVVVTTFASNVARFETIIKAAEKCNRKVALAGKSLWRILDAARESGYLNTGVEFVNEDHIADIPRENLLIISTGCQGEPLAATTKMALGTHPYLRLAPGDNVIFSSKIIPGNEKRIFRLFNQLVKLGVEIFTERDHFVHVSGHPSSQELKKMYELIKPNIAIPVHGELVHIHEHARLAKEWGVPHCLQIENGVISKLAPGEPHAISIVQSGYLGVDGNYLLPSDAPVLRMRRKIQKDGIIIIILVMNKKGKLLSDPIFKSPGCLDPVEDEQLIYDITTDIWNNLTDYLSQNRISEETVKNITRQTTRKLLREEIGKNPIIDITISYVD